MIDEKVLAYVNSFANLAEEVNKHTPIVCCGTLNDEVFMKKLVKPHSQLWEHMKEDNLRGLTLQKQIKGLCQGSTFADKVSMLGMVEATFGG